MDLNRREFLEGVAASPVRIETEAPPAFVQPGHQSDRPMAKRRAFRDIAIDSAAFYSAGWSVLLAGASGIVERGKPLLQPVDGDKAALSVSRDRGLAAIVDAWSILTARREGAAVFAVRAVPLLDSGSCGKCKFLAVWKPVLKDRTGVQRLQRAIVALEAGIVLAQQQPERLEPVLKRRVDIPETGSLRDRSQADLWKRGCRSTQGRRAHFFEIAAAFRSVDLTLSQRLMVIFPKLG